MCLFASVIRATPERSTEVQPCFVTDESTDWLRLMNRSKITTAAYSISRQLGGRGGHGIVCVFKMPVLLSARPPLDACCALSSILDVPCSRIQGEPQQPSDRE